MTDFVLDTSALLTLRDDEPGADRVAELLAASAKGKARCFGCFMTRMEILYRVWKDEDEGAARLAYEQLDSLPMVWVDQSEDLLLRSAAIKAANSLSIADAWIAACAQMLGAKLVHKDPEFAPLAIKQEQLPFKIQSNVTRR